MFKVFVINPGSTSTKLSLFEDDKNVWTAKVFHESHELAKFKCIADQLDYRFEIIKKYLNDEKVDMSNLSAIVGRGGACVSVESGVYAANQKLIDDIVQMKGGYEHASLLGLPLAELFKKEYGGEIFMVDPVAVDEFCDLARMTGLKGLYRPGGCHALNQKGTARLHAEKIGRKYEDLNLIVCHIDGGITIVPHQKGKMIDSNEGAAGDGPFTPSRIGSIGVADFIHYAKGKDLKELEHLCNIGGGLTDLLGTNDADEIMRRVNAGDTYAKRCWDAMIYQICKTIGAMATVLHGDVDGIVLTGGLVRFDYLVDKIKESCGFIAPISVYPGEVEQEAMAAGALRVLRGEITPKVYTGEPVFKGFTDEY